MTPKECERIYNEAYRAVYWTAMSLMKNETDAEDVTQETFVAMLESYDTLQDKTKVVPWLKKICAYKCLNLLSRTKTTAVEQEFLENAETVPENFLPESIVESAEKRKIIMDIIEKALSEDVQRTIILFYFDEMSTQEIAGALGIPLGTVLWRLNFARKKIKQEVERYEKETDTKLHSLALPFLALLFMKEADMVSLPPMSASLAELSASVNAAQTTAAKTFVAETIRKGTGIAMKKFIIACVCTAALGIAVAGGIILNNRDEEEPSRYRKDKTEQSAGVIRERGNKSDDASENKNDETENDQKDDNNPGNQQSAFPKELSSEIQRGSYVLFGSYEQDNNKLNRPEDIEWIVLDCEGDRLLLMSRYVLDAVPFNRDYANVTWETCTLRSWLNDEFINVAFSTEERAMIPQVQIKNFA
ncbi:MAG: sigma-70 family RNA polymerase sigma factor, partial [Lachnospiraceae bacterium]|nr:sigma-70 family RNA polymerase sigma factor [Lachnospiraceae bacterium]